MRVIYFGTPPLSAEILEYLIESKVDIVAIVTQPDRFCRSKKNKKTVKKAAQELLPNVPIFQPEKASSKEFIEELAFFNADLFIVVAYGQILKQPLLDLPKKDCINIHFSLLPKYRGAAPMQRSLMQGDSITGVTIMKMALKMDAGDIIATKSIAVDENMNLSQLQENLVAISCPLLFDVIKSYEKNEVQAAPQDEALVTLAPKIHPQDCEIDWNQDVLKIHNFIRALSEEPGAFCFLNINDERKRCKVLQAKIVDKKLTPKQIFFDQNELFIGFGDKSIQIIEIQLEGKKRMKISDFLRGLQKNIHLDLI